MAHTPRPLRVRLRPRLLIITGVIVVGAAAVLVAAAWNDLLTARSHLDDARAALDHIAADPASLTDAAGRRRAEAGINSALDDINRADHSIRHAWVVRAMVLPGLSRQRHGALRLVGDVRAGATTGLTLVKQMDALAASARLVNGSVDVRALDRLSQDLSAASRAIAALKRSPSGLWGSLAEARRHVDDAAVRSAGRLSSTANNVEAASKLLGAAGPRTYLVAVENNDEMRDQGMILSYAVVAFDGGHLDVQRTGHIDDLALKQPVDTPIPATTQSMFGGLQPRQLWQSVNATADFPWSARTMATMYSSATGGHVDGVIALDVPALESLLAVTGPVQVPGIPQPVSAADATPILLHDLYARAPVAADQPARYELESHVASSIVTALTTGDHDLVSLGRGLAIQAAGRHFLVWSADAQEEDVFLRSGLGGSLADAATADRTFHLDVQNATATKLDYYVHPSVRMDVILTKLGTAVIRTTVTVADAAPTDAAPSYQLGPDGINSHLPGEYVTRMYFWGPAGALQEDSVPESGLQLNQTPLDVLSGRQASVTFETVISNALRDGKLSLRLVPQSRLDPERLDIHLDAPGWHVSGARRDFGGPWSRTIDVTWTCTH